MKYKKIILILITAIFLVSIASVCAADANDTIVTSEDNLEIDQTTNDAIGVEEDTNLASNDENEILTEGEKTFAQLNATINANNDNDIYLNGNYKYSSGDDSFKKGIVIDRDLNIYGNGAVIDGNNQASIFQINGGNVVFYNITFVNGNAGDEWGDYGGAINGNCKAINCTFNSNSAYRGGAMWHGSAVNCTFSGNNATEGGAMYRGSAVNCTFSGNNATEGGAMWHGSAVNCIFSGNNATEGGAMWIGSAVNCIFSGNNATHGDAMYGGYKWNCTCPDYSYLGTYDLNLRLEANNFTTSYCSSEKLRILLFDQNNDGSVGFINCDVVIYKCSTYVKTYHCLSNDELSLDLLPGIYTAKLMVTYPGLDNTEPKNITLTVTDGTTFVDLNKAIKDNTNDTITLDRDYTFNSTVDSAFTDGIVINRQVTINGNGHTIDAKGKARVFNVEASDVSIENLTIKNANITGPGGAIYWDGEWGSVVDCTFINNTAEAMGGAIYWNDNDGSISYCTFINNTAGSYGGAIYWNDDDGSISYCTFINNTAGVYGGAISSNKYLLADYCWFGNTAKNYDRQPIVDSKVICTYWLFLNATSNPDTISVFDTSHVIFKLCIYNSNSGNFIEYDNSPFENLNLSIAATNGLADSVAKLGDVIKYNATCMGTGKITASFETVEYAIEITNLGLDSNLSFDPQKVNYAGSTMIALDYNDLATGTVNMTLKGKNGNSYAFTNLALNATIALPEAINADEYWINVTYLGDNAFFAATTNGTLTVNKANSTLTVNDIVFDYGTGGFTAISFTNASGVNASVIGQPKAIVVVNDTAITVSGLDAGNYTLSVATITDVNHNNMTKTVNITVNKAKTELTADEVITIYNSNNDLVITLKDSASKPLSGFNITVDLNGTKNYTTDTSGQVRIPTMGLAANIYDVLISFNGTDNYLNSSNTTTVSIYKESSRVDTKPLTTDYNVHKYLVVGLKDNEGNPIRNADAFIEIHGVTYKCRSDDAGDARLIIRLNPGTYTAKITFDNVNYTGFTQYVTVIVKKITPKLTAKKKTFKKSKKVKKYTVTLKANNKALAKVKLTLKVKGKTYKAKTNSKGKAVFKIKNLKKKGTFKAKVKFAGNTYYNAVTKTVKIKIK